MSDAKSPNGKRDRGLLRIDEAECKGCGLCIEACPPKVISMSERLNHYGYNPALYAGTGCTGCGICFMVCPEPGAITVYRLVSTREVETKAAAASHPFRDETAEKDGATELKGAEECASN
ncbi:MAG: 4Fe-4S dicluster domain-containing protein [Terracidiphilus sp.]|jgi:Pyruvate/2-oxoacid:ferredoxin oxidoreductase delta subunit